MSIITRIIVAIMIAIGAFSMSMSMSMSMSNNIMSNDMSTQAMNDDSLNIVEDYNNVQADEDMTRIDCHDGNETLCLRYVNGVGEDSFWIDSDGNKYRVPYLHAAYYMDRGSLSMDYYDEWLEAFKADICDVEDEMATCMASIESLNADAMSR